ncbi:diguanylate cyclase [Solidesulfovibrio fructosivorans JJ]]|uniref:diguanylate cyclase n=1 Tax=Solidesulfovibrio fructosivorans JJ] TaxID=596151 RepID=E1JUU2_SOLFR|nr:diguanylate cyclase [Solidesulfovibrio fructosivorans]EFL51856.1 diguanylate cyclase [Solidesulfovibrio fructosivorans JJ]]
MPFVYRITSLSSLLLSALLLLLICTLGHAAVVDVKQGWQYRWGDSPFRADGEAIWAVEGGKSSDKWLDIVFPSNPPQRQGRENVWFRVMLPKGKWRDPVLYIYSVDLIVQVYLEGKKIYQYGKFDEHGRKKFFGWPWHMITLPQDCGGKTLYFRVFSNYMDIGLWGEIKLMERTELLHYIVNNSLQSLIIGSFSLVVALLALFFALVQTKKGTFWAIALYALSAGGMAIGDTQATLLLWYRPLFWDYVSAASYFLVPIASALLLEQWFDGGLRRMFRTIWVFFLCYFVLALGLSLQGLVMLSHTFPVFDMLFALSLPLCLVPFWWFKQMTLEQRSILVAYALLCLLLLLDMAVAHSVVPWGRIPVSWGSLFFIVTIIIISLRYYGRMQKELQALNRSLEEKVQARTRVLSLESEKKGVIGELITGLQQCINVEQARAVLRKELPRLWQPIPGCFYEVQVHGEAYHLSCCWGDYKMSEAQPIISWKQMMEHLEVQEEISWYFPVRIEHPRLGPQQVGAFMLRVDQNTWLQDSEFHHATLLSLARRAMDRINFTLTQLRLQQELRSYSYEDALTGLKNRRFFDDALEREIAQALKQQSDLSLIMLDIDYFKFFNDSYGHAAGDEALRFLAEQMNKTFRHTDIICRYGGEEFVILMPHAKASECHARVLELLQTIARSTIQYAGRDLGTITLSVGISSWPSFVENPQELLSHADRALYQAKERGRNRVVLYGE